MLSAPQNACNAVALKDRDEIDRHAMWTGIPIDAFHLCGCCIRDRSCVAGTIRRCERRLAVTRANGGITVVLQDHFSVSVEQTVGDADPFQDLALQRSGGGPQFFIIGFVQLRVDIVAPDGPGEPLKTTLRQGHGVGDHQLPVRLIPGVDRLVGGIRLQGKMIACPHMEFPAVELDIRFALQNVQELLVGVVHMGSHAPAWQDAGGPHGKPALRIAWVGQIFPVDVAPFGLLSHAAPPVWTVLCENCYFYSIRKPQNAVE